MLVQPLPRYGRKLPREPGPYESPNPALTIAKTPSPVKVFLRFAFLFHELFCTAGAGFLNDRFGLLIYADRHDNFSAPGEFLASFWTNPSKFCNRTGVS